MPLWDARIFQYSAKEAEHVTANAQVAPHAVELVRLLTPHLNHHREVTCYQSAKQQQEQREWP